MLFNRKLEKPRVAAVIAAAGAASRMQGIDKQFEEICGVPVVVRTMLAFSDSDWIDEIIVVARAQDIPTMHALIRAWGVPKVRSVVAGGRPASSRSKTASRPSGTRRSTWRSTTARARL